MGVQSVPPEIPTGLPPLARSNHADGTVKRTATIATFPIGCDQATGFKQFPLCTSVPSQSVSTDKPQG